MAKSPATSPKIGRPTKYLPAYDIEVVDFMGQGYSLTAFAGHIGVGRDTVYEWEKTVPSFSDAVKAARAKRVKALEEGLLKGDSASPQITARIFALKNACAAEWRDKVEVEHSGSIDIAGRLTRARERVQSRGK